MGFNGYIILSTTAHAPFTAASTKSPYTFANALSLFNFYIKSVFGNDLKTYNSSFQSLKLDASKPCKSNAQFSLL